MSFPDHSLYSFCPYCTIFFSQSVSYINLAINFILNLNCEEYICLWNHNHQSGIMFIFSRTVHRWSSVEWCCWLAWEAEHGTSDCLFMHSAGATSAYQVFTS